MDNLKIKINFTQPVRVVPWQKEEKRKFDKAYQRGGTFAKWHMEKELEDLGRPYLTGSILRSALFAELEKMLAVHNPYNCCSMPDKTEDGISRPDFIRKRAVYNYGSKSDYCTHDNPCSLCLLKGRYDKLRRKEKAENKQDHLKNFTVHFSNIKSKADNLIRQKTAVARIVNRVDPETGKAKDYFTIYEIEPSISGNYYGTITINNDDSEQRDKVKKLISAGLAQIKVLAGSICRIDIINEKHDSLIKNYMGVKDIAADRTKGNPEQDSHIEQSNAIENISNVAEEISAIFKSGGREQKLRFTADVIRELRHEDFSIVNDLPKGKDNSGHFLWDQKSTRSNKTLREILKTSAANILSDKWRSFCETLGQKLYELSKKAGTRAVALPRLLGETEYFGSSSKIKDSYIPAESAPSVKWTIAGVLKAETPFFFGNKTTSSQTSNAILLNRDNSFRLPASVIRGALRRDLRTVIGDGCNMPVGGKPCDCPVCVIMKGLIVEDSRSSCTMPPEIRYRIRLNPHTGTVDEGALFDMETGFQGITFPFRLYIETPNLIIDKKLKEVLSLWQSGHAFLGGNSGAGLGRFILDYAKYQKWIVKNAKKYTAYLLCRGYAGTTMLDLNSWDSLEIMGNSDDDFFQWEKIAIKININSPLLSRDVIRAMLDKRNPDAVMFRKAILAQGKENSQFSEFEYRYAIKGESFRGIIRNAVAKGEYGQKEKVYDIDHEECDCIQCRLFGSVHKQGSVRFEDLEVTNFTADNNNDIKMDHVAIDRFTGGGVDQMKFDDYPLPGSKDKTLTLKGSVWIKKGIDEEGKEALCLSFADLRDGFLTLGGLGAIGYGSVETVEFMEKPSWFELPDRNSAIIDFSNKRMQFSFPEPKIENNVIYHPHTFLKPPERNVVREKDPVSHIKNKDTAGNPLWSGKITCSLTTRGPVFIPDTNNDDYFNMKEKYPDHKNYGFFRINNEPAIPGSSIRGMVSSVYEALTNSCFRVMDQKKRLSWRMEAKNLDAWKPGRVIEEEGAFYIEEMEEMRLPVYDNPELKDEIKKKGEKGYYQAKKITNKNGKTINKKGQPADVETLLLDNAEEVRNFLKENADLLSGKASGKWFRGIPHGMDSLALLSKPAKGVKKNSEWVTEGYIHFTGPNKIEVEKKSTGKIGCSQDNIPLNIEHNTVTLDKVTVTSQKPGEQPKQVERERAIPKYVTNSNDSVYTMTKRCERIFFKIKNGKKYVLGTDAREKFHQLCLEYKANRKTIPDVFQTILPKSNNLTSGDLIYFRQLNGKVADVIPVRISRIVDSEPISKKFPGNNDSLRPCHYECVENCDECPELCNKVSDYFSPHPLGLCPACHLFGTAHYKGRVGFSTAWLKTDNPVWYNTNNDNPVRGGALTLPLLERPRPTWSMPDKDAKIPGRKFYIHHPWSVDKIKETVVNENNRTIQPVGKDNVFEFDVRFDNLRKWEIGLLIYTLELEDNLAHKLGMGKAHGMGSVQIKTERVLLKHAFKSTANINKHDKEEIINDGFKHLHNNLLSSVCADVLQNEYIKQLRSLLWLPEKNNDIQVRYPTLEKENDVPGYINLQDNLKKNDRLKFLCTPWDKWHDYSKTPAGIIEKSAPNKSDIKTQPAWTDKPKHTGTVKWFNDKKGFGFIEQENGSDVFVHRLGINEKILNEGDRVKFNQENAQKGPKAIDVEIDK